MMKLLGSHLLRVLSFLGALGVLGVDGGEMKKRGIGGA